MDDVDDDCEDYMEMAQTREVCNHRSEYIRLREHREAPIPC